MTPRHVNGRVEAALRAAEQYADNHRDEHGVTNTEGGMLLHLVSIITEQAGRLGDLVEDRCARCGHAIEFVHPRWQHAGGSVKLDESHAVRPISPRAANR